MNVCTLNGKTVGLYSGPRALNLNWLYLERDLAADVFALSDLIPNRRTTL
jgi:hypothetical protein